MHGTLAFEADGLGRIQRKEMRCERHIYVVDHDQHHLPRFLELEFDAAYFAFGLHIWPRMHSLWKVSFGLQDC